MPAQLLEKLLGGHNVFYGLGNYILRLQGCTKGYTKITATSKYPIIAKRITFVYRPLFITIASGCLVKGSKIRILI
jgi:hypothetical protein